MKIVKQPILKRVIVIICCTFLLFSNIFMYSSTAVYASSDLDEQYDKIIRDALFTAASSLGIFLTGGSAAAIMPIVLSGALQQSNNLKDYVNTYLYSNDDGTTTISENFMNLVLQAYKEYKEENSLKFNGAMAPDANGYYHYDSVVTVKSGWNNLYVGADLDMTVTCTDINTYYPMAILVYSNRTAVNELNKEQQVSIAYPVFYIKSEDKFYSPYIKSSHVDKDDAVYLDEFGQALEGTLFVKQSHYVTKYTASGKTNSGDMYINLGSSVSGGHPATANYEVYSSSVPVYHNLSSLMEGLRTGDFSAAYNYGTMPGCESSGYTGTYGGGDITVSTEKLNGIQEKLDEINETDKSIDDKLKDLLDWLGIGEGSGTGPGITGGSWYDKVLAYLDSILSQLKSIKHWTIVDTVIDGVDAVADWLDLIRGVLSDLKGGAAAAVGTLSSALSDSAGLMKSKFPFSIPWDILFFVTVLSAEPETPHFEIPLDFEYSALDISVNYDLELDFSKFQWLSDLSRLLLSMTYAVGLMKLTAGVTSTSKEG